MLLLLVSLVDDFFMLCRIREVFGIQVAERSVFFDELIGIDGFHLHFNGFNMMQNDMAELVVKVVDIFNIPECGRFCKNITLAERQRITADR